MSQELSILGISALVTVGIQLAGFAAAYTLQTEKFYDILGGLNFLTLGIYSAIDGQYENNSFFSSSRKLSSTIIFLLSRSWLLLFLAWRAHERNGDARFDEVKDKFGLFLVFWMFQAVWVFTISLPILMVNGSDNVDDDKEWSVLEYITIVGFALGVIIEIFADVQKAVWVKKGRQGGFCTVGVWKYSRHPNYFGEIFQWWCLFFFAFFSSTGFNDIQWWFSILSPIMTMHILLNVEATGVANANGKNLKRYYDKCPEEYAEYRKKTSILIPLPFGIYEYVPMFLKRTLFLDFERYEYRPISSSSSTSDDDKDKP